MKKSFVMYMSWMPMLKAMPDEQLGSLMKAVACYQTGEEVHISDPMVAAIWEMIRATFSKDQEKYDEICQRNAENGKTGGRPKEPKETDWVSEKPTGLSENPKKADTDTDNDSEYESDTESVSEKDFGANAPEIHCPAGQDAAAPVAEIVDYLNSSCGFHYKTTTDKTRRLIRARMHEGFTVDDFKIVIDKKKDEWSGTEQEKYLRPETLFGTKFESYLNQTGDQHRTRAPANAFNGFEQRAYDFDDLEKRMLSG